MRVEARRDEQHLRRWRSSAGIQCSVTASRKPLPPVPAESGMLTMFGAGLSSPQYGYSGCWNVEIISTRGSSVNIASVPLPWWTSKSTIATRSRPCASACAAPTATLLNRQNPIARSRSAWCPGGRTAQNALRHSPDSTRSVARRPPRRVPRGVERVRIHRRVGIEKVQPVRRTLGLDQRDVVAAVTRPSCS
jgi:hypothetical protein